MSALFPDTSTTTAARYLSVTASAQNISTTLDPKRFYLFSSSVSCYISQGSAPTAAAANGSMYVPAGILVCLDGSVGATVSVLGTGVGNATLVQGRRQ
jgi:hypothetical protein